GAILVPGSLALLTANFSGEAQGRAYGVWAAATAAKTMLGPFIGGVLVDTISWRVAFLINVPLVVVAVWATLNHVSESRNERSTGRFDWLGAVVVAIAVGGLSFGATSGQRRVWRDPLAYVALAAGVVATIAFPFLMARNRDPLVPLELFRSRNFTVTNISTLVIYGALYVTFYYLALFLQGVLGYSASAAGLAGIPGGLLLVFLSTRFGALSARYRPKIFMTVGPALMAIGVLWFARVPATSPAWIFLPGDPSTWLPPGEDFVAFLPPHIIFGCGLAMLVAPLTTALMTSVPVRNSGVASAINNAISRVGPQLAGALIFVILTANFYAYLASRLSNINVNDPIFRAAVSPLNTPADAHLVAIVREASTSSMHIAMVLGATLLVLGAIVNGIGIKNAAARRPADAETKPADSTAEAAV